MAEWTEAHQREATRRTFELAAELIGAGRFDEAADLTDWSRPRYWTNAPERWRVRLIGAFDPARVDREVRRVRALAEGRLVRSAGWGVAAKSPRRKDRLALSEAARPFQNDSHYPWTRDVAVQIAAKCGGRVVRHTSIRRARP